MKNCKNYSKCGNKIDEKYIYCLDCNTNFAKDNALVDIARSIKQLNWNIGLMAEFKKQSNPKLWNKIKADWKKKNNDPDLENQ